MDDLTSGISQHILDYMEPVSSPIQPLRGFRNHDSWGSGHFLASRDDGARPHLGVDVIAVAGDPVHAPITGRVERLGICYDDTQYYKLIVIDGRAGHAGLWTRLLYVDPNVGVGNSVKAGDVIGVAQNIGARYPGITGHVHVELYQAISIADLLPRYIPHPEAA